MKIEKIDIGAEIAGNYGLQPVKMERLNNVVLLAGRNGSGKSRFLQLLMSRVNLYPNATAEFQKTRDLEGAKGWLSELKKEMRQLERDFLSAPATLEKTQAFDIRKKTNVNNISSAETSISTLEQSLNVLSELDFDSEKRDNHIFTFVPKSLELVDSYNLSAKQIEEHAKKLNTIGLANINAGTIPKIELIQKMWVNVNSADGEDLNISPEEKKTINEDYKRLKEYIKLYLNTDLKRSREGYPVIFNQRIGDAKLSDGQKILLQFCIALYTQGASLDELIIILDEPENHLHPAALIDVLDKIIASVPNGQIWIATHSVNVLAHFNPSDIWYIDEGHINYAGNVPSKVLAGLLGREAEIDRLTHFLSLPSQMACDEFAYQSLFCPTIASPRFDDPQTAQIQKLIRDRENTEPLRILDYGMGKGRLLSTIYEKDKQNAIETSQWLDYFGFDLFSTYSDICESLLSTIYIENEKRYFNEHKDLLSNIDTHSVDLIVMCNVLHEIEPSAWIELFHSATSPFTLLKENGYLLIVEDQLLAVGEKAHTHGFLVLDELELKTLFKIGAKDGYKAHDYRGDGRLKAHRIPAKCLNRIDSSSRKKAIEQLAANAKHEIKKIRSGEPTFKKGKLHGFWTQQLANAYLVLEAL